MADGAKKPGCDKLVLALNPIDSDGNSFTGRFSSSLDESKFYVVPWRWEDVGRARYDVVVFHWPDEFFGPVNILTLKLLAKMAIDRLRRGTKYVWVVHNIRPHDLQGGRPRLTTLLFLRLLSGIILLSDDSRRLVERTYPALKAIPTLVTVHGRYERSNRPAPVADPSDRSGRLLYFGLIRPYKNVEGMIAAARQVVEPFALTVIGTCNDARLEAAIRAKANGDGRIKLDIRREFVPEDELEATIDACDAVILPYRNILNSGAALHALSRNKPVLAPRIGGLPQLQGSVGEEWVRLFDGEITSTVISDFLGTLRQGTSTSPDLSLFSWEKIGSDVTQFLSSLSRSPTQPD